MKLLDSSVLVDIDRGDAPERVQKLDDEGRHGISVVTVTELRHGVGRRYEVGTEQYEQAVTEVDQLLSRFDLLDVTRAVATVAGEITATL